MNEMLRLIDTAKSAEESGDLVRAFQTWASLASEARKAYFYCQLGRVAMKLERWTDAEKAFLDAIAIDSGFAVAILKIGSLFLARTDGDQTSNAKMAKSWLLRALEIDRSAMALSLMGAAYSRLGEKDAAKQMYRDTIEVDQAYEEAYFNLALLLAEEGDDAEAERLLRKAIQLDSCFFAAHGRLGALLLSQGRHSEAESEFRRCIEIDASDYFSNLYLANVLEAQGRETEAEQQYRRAIGIGPSQEPAIRSFADFLARTSRKEEADELRSRLSGPN